MKHLITFALMAMSIVVVAQPKNDLQKENIQGKVKSIIEITCEKENNTTNKNICKKTLTRYNLKGNSIEEIIYNDDIEETKRTFHYDDKGQKTHNYLYKKNEIMEVVKYQFNKKNNLLEIIAYDNNNIQKRRSTHLYNKNGNEIEANLFSKNNSQIKIIYQYNHKNNIDKTLFYNIEENMVGEKSFKYDEKGNRIEEISSYHKKLSKTIHKWQYTYDSNNNWTKEILYKDQNPIQITERVIEYY